MLKSAVNRIGYGARRNCCCSQFINEAAIFVDFPDRTLKALAFELLPEFRLADFVTKAGGLVGVDDLVVNDGVVGLNGKNDFNLSAIAFFSGGFDGNAFQSAFIVAGFKK